jgi:peroxiredoxin
LADYQERFDSLREQGIRVVAASVESRQKAQETIDRHRLVFPVACGLDAVSVAGKTGAFYDSGKGFLHATAFILRPGGVVDTAVYSTGPVGRLTAADALLLIGFRKKAVSHSGS